MSKPLILTVDDDDAVTASLDLLLRRAGYATLAAATPERALELVASRDISLVLQDMNFSLATTGEEGLRLLSEIKKARPDLPVLLITAWGSIELAVQGMKAGAADFVTKPWTHEQILQSVRTALGLAANRPPPSPAARLTRRELEARYDFREVIGEDPGLLEVLDLLGRVSRTDAPVLITGRAAPARRSWRRRSTEQPPPRGALRQGEPRGISVSLFDSEMFGHVRGAFTDAMRDRQGRFALAEGGTILLDEIGELEPGCQVKMLRVLQDRTYEILGSSETRTLDVRVIASTNRDLAPGRGGGEVPGGPPLPPQPDLGPTPIPIGAAGGHPAAGPAFPLHGLPRHRERAVRHRPRGPGLPQEADLAGQRPPAQALDRAGASRHRRGSPEAGSFPGPGGDGRRRALREALPPVGSMTLDEVEKSMILRSLVHHRRQHQPGRRVPRPEPRRPLSPARQIRDRALSLRAKFALYLVLIHLVFGAAMAVLLWRHRPWLLAAEVFFLISFLVSLSLVRSLFEPIRLIRSGADFIRTHDSPRGSGRWGRPSWTR